MEKHHAQVENLHTTNSQELECPTFSFPKEQNSIQSNSVTMDTCSYKHYKESQKKRREE